MHASVSKNTNLVDVLCAPKRMTRALVMNGSCQETCRKHTQMSTRMAQHSVDHLQEKEWKTPGNTTCEPGAGHQIYILQPPNRINVLLVFFFFRSNHYLIEQHEQSWTRNASSRTKPDCVRPSFRHNIACPDAEATAELYLMYITHSLMGPTGSGKTSFINTVSGSALEVGHGLQSCTANIQIARLEMSEGTITLIDTPGFDDTEKPQADVLKEIVAFLHETYKKGTKLAGVIYLHRITDTRMGGIAVENFRLFRKVCGDAALENVAIVTNMWEQVSEEVGESRERELVNNSNFFKDAIDQGARIFRHYNTPISGKEILQNLLVKQPKVLQVQRETVDEHKQLPQTEAGTELKRELEQLAHKHQQTIDRLRDEMDLVLTNKEESQQEALRDIEAKTARLREKMNEIEREKVKLSQELTQDRLLSLLQLMERFTRIGEVWVSAPQDKAQQRTPRDDITSVGDDEQNIGAEITGTPRPPKADVVGPQRSSKETVGLQQPYPVLDHESIGPQIGSETYEESRSDIVQAPLTAQDRLHPPPDPEIPAKISPPGSAHSDKHLLPPLASRESSKSAKEGYGISSSQQGSVGKEAVNQGTYSNPEAVLNERMSGKKTEPSETGSQPGNNTERESIQGGCCGCCCIQ
ncbi:hypothetical protein AcW1_008046 [Taiwanofungus camphoratus]|nr:hypothetical protein AcV5_008345 [Antrodia cinnamomea]KAI0950850.1 hypothetical protein AcW1_008046 [Antrodia cinnamomea]